MARRRRTFWMHIMPSHRRRKHWRSCGPIPARARRCAPSASTAGKTICIRIGIMPSIDALEHYGLKPYFSDFITKDDHFPRKPAPDALLHMISKHGLEPDRAVMVGDRVLDVQAGLNAGMQGALFDPEGFCQGQAPTPYQYASMDALRKALIEDEDVPGDTPKEECP